MTQLGPILAEAAEWNRPLTCLLCGAIFFLVGFFVGWLICRRWSTEIEHLERENRRLTLANDKRERHFTENRDLVSALLDKDSPKVR